MREDILEWVCANSRTPQERRGDLSAQIAANETGMRRLQELAARVGKAELEKRAEENIAYASEAVRRALAELPPGTYVAEERAG